MSNPRGSRSAQALQGLVVSCQAKPGSAFRGPALMSAMAAAAVAGGANGIRANGPEDVAAIRAVVDVPVIGISKSEPRGPGLVYITPDFTSAAAVAAAGADVIATDGTPRPRSDGSSFEALVDKIHGELGLPVMADVDSVDSARSARAAGADIVATTLAGYTDTGRRPSAGPDLELLRQVIAELDCPVVAEGRYSTRDDVWLALGLGAAAVVVGTAITNPEAITRSFL